MSFEVKLSEYAISDLAGIGDYIEFQLGSPQAANKALADIFEVIQMLGEYLESGVSISAPANAYRVFICEKRYAISYIFDKDLQRVWIYRVFHTTQDWLALLLKRSQDSQAGQE